MAESTTDASIVARAQTEPALFAEVFDRHYDTIHDYLTRRLPTGIAEEVAAETFLIAFERRAGYRSEYPSARPWLFGIATNLLGRHRRDERRRMVAYQRTFADAPEDATEDAAARADASVMRGVIAAAVAELEPGDRDALLLQALAELTYSEIAEALDVPEGTVKSRLHRVRQQLARALALEGVNANG